MNLMVNQENHSICFCQIEYKDFKTGFTFNDIRQMLWRESQEKREKENHYMFITRHTILGRWHELKKRMWKEHCDILDEHGCDCVDNRNCQLVSVKKENFNVKDEDVI